MEYHQIANIFPLLQGDELQELADDIRDNGLKEQIWTYKDKILDGRNRSAACLIAGVEPKYREFKGNEEEAFRHVWSLNFHRRHMTPSQKAACAADAVEVLETCRDKAAKRKSEGGKYAGRGRKKDKEIFPEPNKQSRDEVGELFGVSGRYVDDGVARGKEQTLWKHFHKVTARKRPLPERFPEVLVIPVTKSASYSVSVAGTLTTALRGGKTTQSTSKAGWCHSSCSL